MTPSESFRIFAEVSCAEISEVSNCLWEFHKRLRLRDALKDKLILCDIFTSISAVSNFFALTISFVDEFMGKQKYGIAEEYRCC